MAWCDCLFPSTMYILYIEQMLVSHVNTCVFHWPLLEEVFLCLQQGLVLPLFVIVARGQRPSNVITNAYLQHCACGYRTCYAHFFRLQERLWNSACLNTYCCLNQVIPHCKNKHSQMLCHFVSKLHQSPWFMPERKLREFFSWMNDIIATMLIFLCIDTNRNV